MENKEINTDALNINTDDARAQFEDVSNELFGIQSEAEVVEDSTDIQDEPAEVDEQSPETETEEVAQEDSEDDILDDLLGEDDDEGEAEDAEEDSSDIPKDYKTTIKIDGEEVEVTLDELKRGYGQQKSLTKKEMEVADRAKQLDDLQNTITHLQYQGEFAPQFHKLNGQLAALDAAETALANGQAYQGVSGDALATQITTARTVLSKQEAQLKKAYAEKMNSIEAPGRKALEERLPDIKEKFPEYAEKWGSVARGFGFTDVELKNNKDFRWYNMAQEIIEGREYRANMEEKLQRAKSKRKGKSVASKGSPRKATPSSNKTVENTSVNYDDLQKRIDSGDASARHELVNDLFNL